MKPPSWPLPKRFAIAGPPKGITGPLFMGKDTHALSDPAQRTALEVLAGNGAAIDGLKITTKNGWFAARPSGTESVHKLFAESLLRPDHLNAIAEEAPRIVEQTLAALGMEEL